MHPVLIARIGWSRYADGSTYSSTDPSLATLFVDDAPAPGGRQRDGAQLAPEASRYDAGYAKRKMNLTLAFVGTEFQGMQLQSNKDASWDEQPPTIEHRLMSEYQHRHHPVALHSAVP